MSKFFWLSDTQWAAIEPHLPKNQPGARRVDDRRVISGIIHVLETGGRWCDCPPEYGPSTTIYNRFNRWSRRRIWTGLVEALASAGAITKKHVHWFHLYQGASLRPGRQRGAKAQDIGPSRGGQTSKLHALTDVLGRQFAFTLTPSNVSDMKAAPVLLSQLNGARYLLATRATTPMPCEVPCVAREPFRSFPVASTASAELLMTRGGIAT